MRGLIQEGIERGEIRDVDPKIATAALYGSISWIPFWNRKKNPVSTEDLTKEFTGTFVSRAGKAGLRAACVLTCVTADFALTGVNLCVKAVGPLWH